MKRTIVVIDGMGGGIGVQLITKLRADDLFKETSGEDREIVALGTNAIATERMVKAGADRGASGENAVKVSAALGDFILGPIGIVIPNGLMGEITPAMAEAVLSAPGERILIPLQHDHFRLVGLGSLPLAKLVEEAVDYLGKKLTQG
jgi:hypothetical protein